MTEIDCENKKRIIGMFDKTARPAALRIFSSYNIYIAISTTPIFTREWLVNREDEEGRK